jgi:hypothetical protein
LRTVDADDSSHLADVEALAARYDGLARRYERVLELAVAGDLAGIVTLGVNDRLAADGVAFLDDLAVAVADARSEVLSAQGRASAAQERSDMIMLSIAGVWCVLLLVAGAALRLAVAQPLDRVARAARRIAAGDTEERAPSRGTAKSRTSGAT